MHLAILVTNTDKSPFAAQHPLDGEKFTRLVQMARPDWKTTAFQIHEGQFPPDITVFDGAMITGSPASTRSGLPWIAPLLTLIQDMGKRHFPLFGACFGHQAIALALGGTVGENPNGWVHGLVRNELQTSPPWAKPLPQHFNLYGSHSEYVSQLPAGATPCSNSTGLNAGFTVDSHIWTSQHHPEMSPDFITALTKEMRSALGPDLYTRAMASLAAPADQAAFAESLARFFEQAQ
ncbi:type 1 glutamine amidotransferase [Pseudophaeobacter sp.]|uniref:glutamine amidotransferase-related protein n=1 Tax=Pseudophaeobacter sp. TaxID=1971739 RepID=UPI0032970658